MWSAQKAHPIYYFLLGFYCSYSPPDTLKFNFILTSFLFVPTSDFYSSGSLAKRHSCSKGAKIIKQSGKALSIFKDRN